MPVLAHGPVQENVEAAWATDEELQARYVYGWQLPTPTPTDPQPAPHDDLEPAPGHELSLGQPLRDDPTWLYRGCHGTPATRRLRVWQAADGALVAVVTEGPDDEGTSLANPAESVVAQPQAEYPGRVDRRERRRSPRSAGSTTSTGAKATASSASTGPGQILRGGCRRTVVPFDARATSCRRRERS